MLAIPFVNPPKFLITSILCQHLNAYCWVPALLGPWQQSMWFQANTVQYLYSNNHSWTNQRDHATPP
ncbi:hypothetical protein HMPREF0495_01541 [Levilactobacillus brevis ATCC 14869 = DSM 20054]|uniref:Uncharacterized protein n=1 Tax=Levilactobacillus brevis ATCC 14869 = DSM 20054 TaxID=649758 RepID=U2QPS0_LEVBR|nr:hypothetical protein HMPREF0495_01541 [Levilactobacillus brevis ATCC 14869 = DSM 20054]